MLSVDDLKVDFGTASSKELGAKANYVMCQFRRR